MNSYRCEHKDERLDIEAETAFEALHKARAEFQKGSQFKVKDHDIVVTLIREGGAAASDPAR